MSRRITLPLSPLSPYTFCAADPINFIDPSGMILDLSRMTEEEQKEYETQVNELLSISPKLFGTLYNFLQESPTRYYVLFGMTSKTSSGKFVPANYNPSTHTITILNNSKLNNSKNNISPDVLLEEFFHAYQQSNLHLYTEDVNFEFEAKVLKGLVTIESGHGLTEKEEFSGLKFLSDIYIWMPDDDITIVFKEIISDTSNFSKEYLKSANIFSAQCAITNIGGDNYRIHNKSLPVGIQSLIRIFLSHDK